MRHFWSGFFLLALLLTGAAQAEIAVPKLAQRVTDLTATLDATQTNALNAKLAAFESGKGSQIAVLILPTTQPETIEQFGIRVMEAWKLGRKGVNDGVLLLVAKDDHKLRIEVGYGLEGALNDATVKRIVAEVITPHFKRGEFYAGIDAGVAAIIKVVDGEPLPAPVQHAAKSANDSDQSGALIAGAIFLVIFGNVILRQFVGLLPSGAIVGGVVGAMVWFFAASMLWAGLAGVAAFIASLVMGAKGSSGFDQMPLSSGWGGSSFGGGSGGSSDSFSGGGESGGGGASGDW